MNIWEKNRRNRTMNKPSKLLAGKWRIKNMPDFDQKDVDADGPAQFKVKANGEGEFQFLYVKGYTDGNFKNLDAPTYDFTWNGNDECDEAFGDGWIKTNPDGTI